MANRSFTKKEKQELVRLVEFSGSVTNALEELNSVRKDNISAATLRKIYHEMTGKTLPRNKKSRYHPEFVKACMKIAEIHGKQWVKVQQIVEKDLKVKVPIITLRKWQGKYAKELSEGNQFKDVVQTLTERHASKYVLVIDHCYTLQELAVKRMLELIPKERDLDKVTRAMSVFLKVIQSPESGDTEKQTNLFTQINNYISENGKKLKLPGDIQDVTPEPEQ